MFTYQGDGDLASIGTAEIVHAATRGENITIIFVNNAIYGMTGGQMAPTTLPGQVTTTSPLGRDVKRCGYPVPVSEMLATLEGSAFIERVSVHDVKHVSAKPRPRLKRLSPSKWKTGASRWWKCCPPARPTGGCRLRKSLKWLDGKHDPRLSAGRVQGGAEVMEKQFLIAGFGGQGVLLIGQLIAKAAMLEGKEVSWMPSYGPEMRGGEANCAVVVSTEPIGSPLVSEPLILVAMNGPSLRKFMPKMPKKGLLLYNSSLIEGVNLRDDIDVIAVPCNTIAESLQMPRVANMVMLGAIQESTRAFTNESLIAVMADWLGEKKANLLDINKQALGLGRAMVLR